MPEDLKTIDSEGSGQPGVGSPATENVQSASPPVTYSLTSRYDQTIAAASAGAVVSQLIEPVPAKDQPLVQPQWTPNDTFYASWQWNFTSIGMPQAWDYNQGGRTDVTVAVLDTGVAAGIPDLAQTHFDWADAYDYAYNDSNPDDNYGHGTHVTGTIAESTNNGYGVAGMAFNSTILPIKVLDDSGSGTYANVAAGIYRAVGAGADVISMSLGGGYDSSDVRAACQYAYNSGVLVVAAAGNDGTYGFSYPAAYSTTLAVGAIDSNNSLASFSQYGYDMVVAPGVGITQQLPDGSFGSWSGTSMATPHVAGLAALILAESEDLGLDSNGVMPAKSAARVDWLRSIIIDNTQDLGAAGQDMYYGWGKIRADWALASLQDLAWDGDYAADTGTRGAISVGGSASSDLGFAGDRDWFRVNLNAGATYWFTLEGADSGQGTLVDPRLYLYNSSGAQIAENDDNGTDHDSRIIYSPTANGTFYLGAASADDVGTGTYRLAATLWDDYLGDSSTPASLSAGGVVGGEIERAGDHDWFRITLAAGSRYEFDLAGSALGAGTLTDPYLILRDGSGTQLAADDDSGQGSDSRIAFRAVTGGTYFLDATGAGSAVGTYVLAARLDDYAGDATTDGLLTPNGSITGNLEITGDRDWFRIQLAAGGDYTFDLEGSATGQGTLFDPYLRLYDSAGTLVAYDDDVSWPSNPNSRISYTATTTATYYLGAGAFADDYTGTYRLSAAVVDDYEENTSTSGVLSVEDSPVSGRIDFSGDRDWFRLELGPNRRYYFEVQSDALTSPYLTLYDSTGVESAVTDRSSAGGWQQVTFDTTAGGTFYLGASSQGVETGAYTLGADVRDDYTADVLTTGRLPIIGSTTGDLERRGDEDWFRADLVAGRQYTFDVQAAQPDAGSLILGVNDASGAQVSQGDSGLTFTPQTSGIYYVAVSSGAAPGGTGDVLTTDPGRAISDSWYQPENCYDDLAFDNDSGTYWATATSGAGSAGVAWLGYDFGSGHDQAVGAFTLQNYTGWHAPTRVRLQHSGDGSTWTDQESFDLVFDGEAHTYQVSGAPATDRFWRILADTPVSIRWLVRELDFMEYVPASGGLGSYRLSGTVADDYAGDVSTLGALSSVGNVSGDLETPGDTDWFKTDLIAGNEYTFDLDARAGADPLSDPLLKLYDSAGTEIPVNDGDGDDSRIVFTPGSDGTYYLGAESAGGGTGTYQLSSTVYDDYGNDVTTTSTLSLPGSARGDLAIDGDQDWFRVNLVAGRSYTFDLAGALSGQGSLNIPVVTLYDALGQGVDQEAGTQSGDPSLAFTPQTSGIYYVAASSGGATGGTGDVLTTDPGRAISDSWYQPENCLDDLAFDDNTATYWATATSGADSSGVAWLGYDFGSGNDQAVGSFTLQNYTGWHAPTRVRLQHSGDGSTWADQESFDLVFDGEAHTYQVSGAPATDRFWRILADTPVSIRWLVRELDFNEYVPASGGLGSYRLSGTVADDYAGDVSTLGALSSVGNVSGDLETPGDTDWFKTDLIAGNEYTFDLDARAGADPLSDPLLKLYDSAGTEIPVNDGDGDDSRIVFTPGSDGTYYLGAESAGGGTGTYQLTSTVYDDYGNDVTTTSTLALPGSARGDLAIDGDQDWFRLDLVAGRSYTFDLAGALSGQGSLTTPVVTLYDALGQGVDQEAGTQGGDPSLAFTPQTSGIYYVAASSGGATGGTGDVLTTDPGRAISDSWYQPENCLDDLAFDDNTATYWATATSGADSSGVAWLGYDFGSGNDQAVGSFTLQNYTGWHAPTRVRLQHSGDGSTWADQESFDLVFDGEAHTYQVSGAPATDRFWRILADTPVSIRWLVRELDFNEYVPASGGLGSYRLSGTVADDYAGDVSTLGALSSVGNVSGDLETPGDTDWFKTDLIAGNEYTFDLDARAGADPLSDPLLKLYDSAGTEIPVNDGDGDDSRIVFTPGLDGTYYLGAESIGGDTGTYQLTSTINDDHGDDVTTTSVLSVPGSEPGNLAVVDDQDWFRVNLAAGQAYTFDLEGALSGQGSLTTPVVTLYDALGQSVDQEAGTQSGDPSLTFTPQTSGVYYVAASSGGATGGTGDVLTTDPGRAISDSWYQPENCLDDLAFDDNTATYWATATSGADSSGVAWLGYDFGSGNDQAVGSFTLQNYTGWHAPTRVRLQHSADGSTWIDQESFDLVFDGEAHTYQVSGTAATDRYWRLLADTAVPIRWLVRELDFNEYVPPVSGTGTYLMTASQGPAAGGGAGTLGTGFFAPDELSPGLAGADPTLDLGGGSGLAAQGTAGIGDLGLSTTMIENSQMISFGGLSPADVLSGTDLAPEVFRAAGDVSVSISETGQDTLVEGGVLASPYGV